MDIKQLRYFVAVARRKNITVAANEMFISQQGLSMAISRLEKELSCRLFIRNAGGMNLTKEGEYLLSRAEKLLFQFDEMEAYFVGPSRNSTIVRVASAFGGLPEFFGNVLDAFRDAHPEFHVDIEESNDVEADKAVEDGNAEVGFGVAPFNQQKLVSLPVYSSPHCLLVHSSHPLAKLERVSLRMLEDTPIMIMNTHSKTNVNFVNYCTTNNISLNIKYLAGEVIAIHRLVAMNSGIGISVQSVADSIPIPDVVAIPFEEPELTWKLCLIKRVDAILPFSAEVFCNFVSDYVKKINEDGNQ